MPTRASARPLLICLSHLRWKGVWQRPQHLTSRAGRNYDVVFFEEPVAHGKGPNWLRIERVQDHVSIATPYVDKDLSLAKLIDVQRQFVETLTKDRKGEQTIAWYYTPMAYSFAGSVPFDTTVYDCMDELSCFKNAPNQIAAKERELLEDADLVFAGGRSLYDAKRRLHDDVHLFPSSVDVAHFLPARAPGLEPDDQAGLGKPRIGYYAVIDERFDIPFFRKVAQLRPDWTFVVIGPVAKISEEDLPHAENIEWLGMRDYRDLPSYMRGWDAVLMPFALNESTRYISPTKTPEFLAAGLPVVSTPVADVVSEYGSSGLVEIAATPEAAVAKLDVVMRRERTAWLERVDAHLQRSSWSETWQKMEARIEEALDRKTEPMPEILEAAHV